MSAALIRSAISAALRARQSRAASGAERRGGATRSPASAGGRRIHWTASGALSRRRQPAEISATGEPRGCCFVKSKEAI